MSHKLSKQQTDYAQSIMYHRVFKIQTSDGTEVQFTIEEVELYTRDDPYTHGHPSQLEVGEDMWYFHRASSTEGAKYKGGTFKGVDITMPQDISGGGGCLIRSINIPPTNSAYPNGLFIEGPCKVVNWFLEQSGCTDIAAFVAKNGTSVRNGTCISYVSALDDHDDSEMSDVPLDDNTIENTICFGPRVGLGFPHEDDLQYADKYRMVFAPRRFCTRFAADQIGKYKALMMVCPDNVQQHGKSWKIRPAWKRAFEYAGSDSIGIQGIDGLLRAYGKWWRTEFFHVCAYVI
jgi:hypothetical protein